MLIYNTIKHNVYILYIKIFRLVMLINGALGYSETSENKEDIYLIVTIFGALFFALSILLFSK